MLEMAGVYLSTRGRSLSDTECALTQCGLCPKNVTGS